MRKNDMRLISLQDIVVALVLLTRLPLPVLPKSAFERQARAVWAFPLVGLVVGAIAASIGWLTMWIGLPAAATTGLILTTQIVITGAMHEDGLADTVDGLWGGWTPARRLEIMKDSAIGTYGVLALILSLGLRWVALTALVPQGLMVVIAAAVLSRAALPAVMAALPAARSTGLSHSVGAPEWRGAGLALGIGVGTALACLGSAAVAPLFMGFGAVFGVAVIAKVKIGGQTGDILGACQQIAEITILLTLATLLGP